MGVFWFFFLLLFLNVRHPECMKNATKRLTDLNLQRPLQFFSLPNAHFERMTRLYHIVILYLLNITPVIRVAG